MTNRITWLLIALTVALALAACSLGCSAANEEPLSDPPADEEPLSDPPGKFSNPQFVTIAGYEGWADEPFLSRDGQYLFFNDPNGGLFYARRITDTSFEFLGKVQGLDPSAVYNGVPSMDEAGNFYFVSAASPATYRIHRGTFADGTITNVSVLGITEEQDGQDQEISADGQTMYYMVPKITGSMGSTLEVASRSADGSFTKLANSDDLLKNITADDNAEYAPDISSDGLELYYVAAKPEPGIHVARRSSTSEPFGFPELVVAEDGLVQEAPSISPDGTHLYYGKQIVIEGVVQFLMHIAVMTR